MQLDERMKFYEKTVGGQLTMRCPAIIRLDGRAFHTFTKSFSRPYDKIFRSLMVDTARRMCEEISTAKFAYGYSDEISILLVDYVKFTTDQFFGGMVQKIVSVMSSVATNTFNQALYKNDMCEKLFKATFDARVFSIPERDVANYFVWRQRDCVRNSIQALGQSCFSHQQLHRKSMEETKKMLLDVCAWEGQSPEFKYGFILQYDKQGWTNSSSTIPIDQIEKSLEPIEC